MLLLPPVPPLPPPPLLPAAAAEGEETASPTNASRTPNISGQSSPSRPPLPSPPGPAAASSSGLLLLPLVLSPASHTGAHWAGVGIVAGPAPDPPAALGVDVPSLVPHGQLADARVCVILRPRLAECGSHVDGVWGRATFQRESTKGQTGAGGGVMSDAQLPDCGRVRRVTLHHVRPTASNLHVFRNKRRTMSAVVTLLTIR